MSTIAERVAAGAALLDAKLPDWWRTLDVDLAEFDMTDGCKCVIGQLYPTFADFDADATWDSAFDVAVNSAWLDLDWQVAVSHGFFAATNGGTVASSDEYAALGAEWRRVITERRAAA